MSVYMNMHISVVMRSRSWRLRVLMLMQMNMYVDPLLAGMFRIRSRPTVKCVSAVISSIRMRFFKDSTSIFLWQQQGLLINEVLNKIMCTWDWKWTWHNRGDGLIRILTIHLELLLLLNQISHSSMAINSS